MFRAGAEAEAEAIIRTAGHDPRDRPSVQRLSLCHLGTAPAFADISVPAKLVRHAGRPQIVVREGTSPARARLYAAHELAHWWCRDWPQVQAIEYFCDAVAVGLVAPRVVFGEVFRECRGDLAKTAAALGTTQSLVMLRIGEVFGHATAVARPHGVLARGARRRWPTLGWRFGQRPTPRGLVPVRITDEPSRLGYFSSSSKSASSRTKSTFPRSTA